MEPAETRPPMGARPRSIAVGVLVAALAAFGLYAAVNGYSGSAADEPYSPATVGTTGASGVSPLTLEERATQRLGLVTAPVRAAGRGRTAIPYSAVVYDPEGVAWAYVASAPLTYVRHKLSVVAVEGVVAVLTSGPPVGTMVVSVGGVELFGAEIDFGKG